MLAKTITPHPLLTMAEKRTKLGALPKVNSKFYYGYTSPNKDELTKLGLKDLETGTPDKDVAFSPKNVKPNRAYRPGIIAKGGFCSVGVVAALEADGYNISRKNPGVPKAGKKSVIVGVKLSPNLVFAWRYRKSSWDALPADVKADAGIALASTYNASEIAYHADGVILATANADLDLQAGVYYGKASLKRSYTSTSNNKTYSLYGGSVANPGP
jgi:hypothetical protein